MLYFGLYVQLRRGSVAGYTTDESWAYGPKEGVEAFESITFFIRFIYAINFEHLLILFQFFITVSSVLSQLLLDTDKLVVLCHTVGTAHRTCLDLTRVGCHSDIGDCRILCFT